MVATGNSQPSKLTNRDRVQEDSCNVHSGAFHSDCLTFCFSTAWGQTNACDLTGDRVVNTADVQAAINISLGISPCTANIVGANVCNAEVVQRVINAYLGGGCLTSVGLQCRIPDLDGKHLRLARLVTS
jgi:hypothetical protein